MGVYPWLCWLNPPFVEPLTPVGVRQTFGQIELIPGITKELVFSECGIPKGSRILYLNYTPMGSPGVFPVELHGTTPSRTVPQEMVRLWPRELQKDPSKTQVSVLIAWVPEEHASGGWKHLVEAFDAVSDGRYSEAIIPANVAVESHLYGLLLDVFAQSTSLGQARQLLRSAYYHQLNSLLPHLTSVANAPPLRNEIVDGLNELLQLRNQLAHQGRLTQDDLAASKSIELVCAALFGHRYIEFVRSYLAQ